MTNQQQPDKFFKEKLENIQQPAPPAAWMKIEKGLAKKNNKGLWLKVAASLLAATVVAYLIWPREPIVPAERLTATHRETPEKKPANTALPTDELTAKAERHQPVDQSGKESVAKAAEKNFRKDIDASGTTKNKRPVINKDEKQETNIIDGLSEPMKNSVAIEVNKEIETVPVKTEKQDHNFKLVIEADEVNAKYLNKKSFAQATREEQKSSRLRKLLDKAYDLKNNQDPFGELRQKKNEILALNIQGDKRQGQNK